MSVVSSIIVEDRVQRDGRRSIGELHTDHVGATYYFTYLALASDDVQARMVARVADIEQGLSDSECNSMIAEGALRPFVHATAAALRNRVRQAYRNGTQLEACRIAAFVVSLGLSDAQYTAAFGVSGAQLTALKAKLSNQAAKYNAILTEAGQ